MDNKKKVYVLDDEKFILALAEKMLTVKGYEPSIFLEPNDFLDALLKNKPDVVIIDYMMPSINGEEMIARIKAEPELSDLPILLYSAADPVKLREIIKNTGATGFLPKGIKMTEFVERMETTLGW